jgi:SPP1 family predicted phage head-tail adaptor
VIKCERKELTDPITIATVTRVADGQGGYTESWANLTGMPCFARVRAKRGQSEHGQGAVRPVTEYEVTIRARTDIQAGQRVTWRGIAFRIAPPVQDSWRDRWATFTITSGVKI